MIAFRKSSAVPEKKKIEVIVTEKMRVPFKRPVSLVASANRRYRQRTKAVAESAGNFDLSVHAVINCLRNS
jgi:hypothetical protein